MPVMHFNVRWPDGRATRCYSPSLVIKDYFEPGTDYPLPEFLRRARQALGIASERVRARYGFACAAATGQLAQLEAEALHFESRPGAAVRVLSFEE